MAHPKSNYYPKILSFTGMSPQINTDEGTDNLKLCCGELLASNHEHEHTLCDSVEDDYTVGGGLIN